MGVNLNPPMENNKETLEEMYARLVDEFHGNNITGILGSFALCEKFHAAMLSQSIPSEEDELRVMGTLLYHLKIHQETYSKWHDEDIARVLLKLQKQLLNY